MTALDTAIAAMPSRVRIAHCHDVKAGALLMLRPNSQWRIHSALFRRSLGPLPDDVEYLIGMASRRVDRMRVAALTGHWSYERSRHVSAMQALLALRWLRRHGWVSIERGPISGREREAA